jgi:hypothetical protein
MPILNYPYCLKPRGMPAFATSIYPVQIARTSSGVEARKLLSEIPYGAYIELEYAWSDTEIVRQLIDFWPKTEGDHKNFRIPDDHRLWQFCPIAEYFRSSLPTNVWRFEQNQIVFSPRRTRHSDFRVKLLNLIGEE